MTPDEPSKGAEGAAGAGGAGRSGAGRSGDADAPKPAAAAHAGTTGGEPAARSSAGAGTAEPSRLPPPSLSLLIASLAAQAQVHLGLHAHPSSGTKQKNLPAAKHAIDLLGVLEEKTRGNLTREEAILLSDVLASLRLAYVGAVRA